MRRITFGTLTALAVCAATMTAAAKDPIPTRIELVRPVTSLTLASGESVAVWPALGEVLTFRVTLSKDIERLGPRIVISCYQNDQLVYGEAGPYDAAFTLGGSGSLWMYGLTPADRQAQAHCVATLFYWSYDGRQKWNYLADTQFDAAGAPAR